MELIIGLLTFILIAITLKVLGVDEGNLYWMTILVILFALPLITKVGEYVLNLF